MDEFEQICVLLLSFSFPPHRCLIKTNAHLVGGGVALLAAIKPLSHKFVNQVSSFLECPVFERTMSPSAPPALRFLLSQRKTPANCSGRVL